MDEDADRDIQVSPQQFRRGPPRNDQRYHGQAGPNARPRSGPGAGRHVNDYYHRHADNNDARDWHACNRYAGSDDTFDDVDNVTTDDDATDRNKADDNNNDFRWNETDANNDGSGRNHPEAEAVTSVRPDVDDEPHN